MKKTILSIIVLLFIAGFGFTENDSRLANEPIQRLIQGNLESNSRVFDKNLASKVYLNAFLTQWKEFMGQLFSQDSAENHLESFFAQNHLLAQKTLPSLQKMKPPAEYKDFQEVLSKGVEELSDWCLDMRDRIHYAKTDYQRSANMKRIEGFRSEWYDTFFGEALDELVNSLSTFVVSHWMDNLDADQLKALQNHPNVKQYLIGYHKTMTGHLKVVAAMTKKARDLKEKYKGETDPRDYLESIQKEVEDLKKTEAGLKKVAPPDGFQSFHSLQLAWLDSALQANQKIVELEEANRKQAPDEKIQALINEKNQLDSETRQLKADADKAYLEALKKLSASSSVTLH